MTSMKTKAAFAVITALSAGPIAAGAAPTVAGGPAPGPVLTSTSVVLPDSDREFPQGPNVDVVSANCAGCHSPGMILNQPGLSKTAWEGEVKKMINVYKAPVSDADVPAIVTYLAATKGS